MKANELKKKYGLDGDKKALLIKDNLPVENDSFASEIERMIDLYDVVCQDDKKD